MQQHRRNAAPGRRAWSGHREWQAHLNRDRFLGAEVSRFRSPGWWGSKDFLRRHVFDFFNMLWFWMFDSSLHFAHKLDFFSPYRDHRTSHTSRCQFLCGLFGGGAKRVRVLRFLICLTFWGGSQSPKYQKSKSSDCFTWPASFGLYRNPFSYRPASFAAIHAGQCEERFECQSDSQRLILRVSISPAINPRLSFDFWDKSQSTLAFQLL
jgi:hypothetical protein